MKKIYYGKAVYDSKEINAVLRVRFSSCGTEEVRLHFSISMSNLMRFFLSFEPRMLLS